SPTLPGIDTPSQPPKVLARPATLPSTTHTKNPQDAKTFFRNREESMDRLDELHLFVRVAEMGSITAAARSLDVSLSVASQRLKHLEQRLGVRLFNRTTRRLSLTPEGAAL